MSCPEWALKQLCNDDMGQLCSGTRRITFAKLLLEAKAIVPKGAITRLANRSNDDAQLVQILLSAALENPKRKPLQECSDYDIRFRGAPTQFYSPIHAAALRPNPAILQVLIDGGVNPFVTWPSVGGSNVLYPTTTSATSAITRAMSLERRGTKSTTTTTMELTLLEMHFKQESKSNPAWQRTIEILLRAGVWDVETLPNGKWANLPYDNYVTRREIEFVDAVHRRLRRTHYAELKTHIGTRIFSEDVLRLIANYCWPEVWLVQKSPKVFSTAKRKNPED